MVATLGFAENHMRIRVGKHNLTRAPVEGHILALVAREIGADRLGLDRLHARLHVGECSAAGLHDLIRRRRDIFASELAGARARAASPGQPSAQRLADQLRLPAGKHVAEARRKIRVGAETIDLGYL